MVTGDNIIMPMDISASKESFEEPHLDRMNKAQGTLFAEEAGECFHEGPNFLVIDPDECIDCAACVPECPADAIFADDELPADQRDFTALNAELSKNWPVIFRKKAALPDAETWNGKGDKRPLLRRS